MIPTSQGRTARVNAPISTCRRSNTHDSITALRHGSPPACVETSNRLLHAIGVAQCQFLGNQPPQRLAQHVCRARADRLQPAGDVVGQVGRRVRMIRAVAFPRVACIKRECAKPRPEMALGPAERPVVPPHPAEENEGVALLTHFLVVKRATLYDNLGHERDRHVQKTSARRIEHAPGNQARFAQGKEYASNEKAKIDDS